MSPGLRGRLLAELAIRHLKNNDAKTALVLSRQLVSKLGVKAGFRPLKLATIVALKGGDRELAQSAFHTLLDFTLNDSDAYTPLFLAQAASFWREQFPEYAP
jgi:hypothetical protein